MRGSSPSPGQQSRRGRLSAQSWFIVASGGPATVAEGYEAAVRRRDERTRSGGLMGTNAVAGNR